MSLESIAKQIATVDREVHSVERMKLNLKEKQLSQILRQFKMKVVEKWRGILSTITWMSSSQ